MESIRTFFAWWFGELAAVFSGRSRSPLALLFSQQEVALVERGTDMPLGIVAFDAPDRAARIEALRSIAEKRTGPNAPVELRLPREQVIFREIEGPVSESGTRNLAVRIAETCGRKARELTAVSGPAINLSEGGAPGILAAAALSESVGDAVRMARQWGFEALRVTSVDWPQGFVDGPEFYSKDVRVRSTMQSRVMLGLAALTLLLTCAAAVRALSVRSALAEESRVLAASANTPNIDLMQIEVNLAEFAHAASSAIEGRGDTVPAWYILSELAALMPADIALRNVDYRPGTLRLKGTGSSIDTLIRDLDRSPLFSGARVYGTKALGKGEASFDISVSVNGRGPQ